MSQCLALRSAMVIVAAWRRILSPRFLLEPISSQLGLLLCFGDKSRVMLSGCCVYFIDNLKVPI